MRKSSIFLAPCSAINFDHQIFVINPCHLALLFQKIIFVKNIRNFSNIEFFYETENRNPAIAQTERPVTHQIAWLDALVFNQAFGYDPQMRSLVGLKLMTRKILAAAFDDIPGVPAADRKIIMLEETAVKAFVVYIYIHRESFDIMI